MASVNSAGTNVMWHGSMRVGESVGVGKAMLPVFARLSAEDEDTKNSLLSMIWIRW